MKKATPEMIFAACLRIAGRMNAMDATHESVDAFNKDGEDSFYTALAERFAPKQEVLPPVTVEFGEGVKENALSGWVGFYKKYFGIDVDLSGLQIPAKVAGFDRLIVVVKGIGLNKVYDACSGQFNCYKYTDSDLEGVVTKNDRDPANGTYAIWVRDVVEADEEMKNLSANNIKKKMVDGKPAKGVTLLERLVHELKYFSETGNHLDIQNVTLCSGSRYSDGGVPHADWSDGRLHVGWANPGRRYSRLRSRVAVG